MKLVENKVAKSTTTTPLVIASGAENFTFRLERDDTEYTLPLIQDLPAKAVLKLSKADGEEGIELLIDLFDQLAPGLTDIATQRDLSLIMEAWSEASQMSMGES